MSKKIKVIKDTNERWLLTYADLMNLLLILFILLYSYRNADLSKYKELSESIVNSFGNNPITNSLGEGGSNNAIYFQNLQSSSAETSITIEQQQILEVKKMLDENLIGQEEKQVYKQKGLHCSIT